MTARYGNPDILKKKYGQHEPSKKKINMEKTSPTNPKATFNGFKITLPSEPSLIVESKRIEDTVIAPTKQMSVDNYKNNLLNFIDTSKLIEGRPGFKSKSYFLEDLKHYAKLLNIFKNEKPKSYFIEKINEEIVKSFGDKPNLVADIKAMTIDEIKIIKNMENLFIKHHIAEPTKTDLLKNIKYTIKNYRTSNELVQQVINVIEQEWIQKK